METKGVCSVPANVLRGLLKIAPKIETRYYLVGVYFNTTKNTLVATDGRAMLLVKCELDKSVAPFIVRRETIEAALKLSKPNSPILVQKAGREVRLEAVKGLAVGNEIDGKYPAYQSVIPASPSGKDAEFDPRLVARLTDGMELAAGSDGIYAQLTPNGEKAGLLVSKHPEVLGVVMPRHAPKGVEEFAGAALTAFGFAKPAAKAAA